MNSASNLPAPPRVKIEVVGERAESESERFLTLRRLTLRNHHETHGASAPYSYDLVERQATDAVAMVLFVRADGGPLLCLRTALRPPVFFRSGYELPIADPEPNPVSWEVPAGLVEPSEKGEVGILRCAARETLEEAGFDISSDAFSFLGKPVTLSPGVIGERLYFARAEVGLGAQTTPTEDGSPVEAHAEIRFVTVAAALAAIDDGTVADAKSEVAIRRFSDWWNRQ